MYILSKRRDFADLSVLIPMILECVDKRAYLSKYGWWYSIFFSLPMFPKRKTQGHPPCRITSATENTMSSIWQLCRHWCHRRLSLRQLTVPPVPTKFQIDDLLFSLYDSFIISLKNLWYHECAVVKFRARAGSLNVKAFVKYHERNCIRSNVMWGELLSKLV